MWLFCWERTITLHYVSIHSHSFVIFHPPHLRFMRKDFFLQTHIEHFNDWIWCKALHTIISRHTPREARSCHIIRKTFFMFSSLSFVTGGTFYELDDDRERATFSCIKFDDLAEKNEEIFECHWKWVYACYSWWGNVYASDAIIPN